MEVLKIHIPELSSHILGCRWSNCDFPSLIKALDARSIKSFISLHIMEVMPCIQFMELYRHKMNCICLCSSKEFLVMFGLLNGLGENYYPFSGGQPFDIGYFSYLLSLSREFHITIKISPMSTIQKLSHLYHHSPAEKDRGAHP